MTAMYQGELQPMQAVGPKGKGRLPGPAIEPIQDGQPNKPMSDLYTMMEDERNRHQQQYNYAHGHNDGSSALGKGSF